MKDIKLLEKLLELLNESNVGAIEVHKNLWSTTIKVSKNSLPSHSGPVTYQVAAGSAAAAPPQPDNPAAAPATTADAAERADAAATPHLTEIHAPMVGTFYAQPEPGAEPYVGVGSRITPGTTLCIIEAMKIMNPIDAEISGVIKEVCIQDSQPVEFGQVLFRVDANE
ncbi:MAG: acetyl-CoA carboxylase biotin carboxyl carrier protein [Gemmatimonadota bacterium]|nr:acetyl-CoA carboxylase biotin carboxyl carrier protein [Gemmatimonadota bacterium]